MEFYDFLIRKENFNRFLVRQLMKNFPFLKQCYFLCRKIRQKYLKSVLKTKNPETTKKKDKHFQIISIAVH
jgi:hypothetical protein